MKKQDMDKARAAQRVIAPLYVEKWLLGWSARVTYIPTRGAARHCRYFYGTREQARNASIYDHIGQNGRIA